MDANTLAKSIVDQATGDKPIKKKNPRKQAGAVARAKTLGPKKLSKMGKKAASMRWGTSKG
jgi:hypothetical protein